MNQLTGEQRYWQAVKKARLIGARNLRRFMAGEIDILPALDERTAIIAEMDRIIRAIPSQERSDGR